MYCVVVCYRNNENPPRKGGLAKMNTHGNFFVTDRQMPERALKSTTTQGYRLQTKYANSAYKMYTNAKQR